MGRQLSRRRYGEKQQKNILWIFCEGKNTEPIYLQALIADIRLTQGVRCNLPLIKVIGTGKSTLALVNYVRKCKVKKESETKITDEWWLVYDRDSHSNFDQSILEADRLGMKVAYSNQSFELWFILHFQLLDSRLTRDDYNKILSKKLGFKYDKEKGICTKIFPLIKAYENSAIVNAKKLESNHDALGVTSPEARWSSTTVYQLVERLRK